MTTSKTPNNKETTRDPKSGNTNTTNIIKRKPIKLPKPYNHKKKPVNPSFACQLKHFMEARTPQACNLVNNIAISTDESSNNDAKGNKVAVSQSNNKVNPIISPPPHKTNAFAMEVPPTNNNHKQPQQHSGIFTSWPIYSHQRWHSKANYLMESQSL